MRIDDAARNASPGRATPSSMVEKRTRGFTEEGGRSQVGVQPRDWLDERAVELREKARRGEALTHAERMSLAIDEGVL